MTDPLMSKVKEAAEAYSDRLHDYAPDVPDEKSQAWFTTKQAFIHGAQFLLAERSRAEEGHGPRVWLAPGTFICSERETKDFSHARAFTEPDPQGGDAEYCYVPLSELLAVKAELELLKSGKGE